ncbi:MAG TPA: hypothetical protein VJO35_02695 [Terriglobales bacterium]|nr:hypothetical protein [Terriglobales bacterium]
MQSAQQETHSKVVGDHRAVTHAPAWQVLTESVVLAAVVCLGVFSLQWRYGFNLGDEGWLWYISKRTALGDVPLRDFFSYDPGRYYWSAFIFKLLGRSGFYEQILANYLFAIIGLTLAYVAMVRAGLSRAWRILLLLLLGIVIGFPRHKLYEQTQSLIAVAAVAFVFRASDRPKRWLLLGVVIGLAAFVGRNSGVFCFVAALLAFVLLKVRGEPVRIAGNIGSLTAGTIIGYSPMICMILFVRGFARPFFESVLLTPHWAWSLPIPFPWHVHVRGLRGVDLLQARAVSWLCVVVPLTYLFLLWRTSRLKRELDGAEWLAAAASCAGVGFLIHAFYTADFFHIAQGVVPFVVAAGSFAASYASEDRLKLDSDFAGDGARATPNRARALSSSLAIFGILTLLVLACWLPMEPLVEHLRTKAHAPSTVTLIAIAGRKFEVPREQADLMTTVATSLENCGARDGSFFAAPYYPGLYAFLGTRAPTWDTYFLWPRSNSTQQREIDSLRRNHTALFLLNREFAMNGRDGLKVNSTNPVLLAYITAQYERSAANLSEGFELYYDPAQCKNFFRANP